jgi:diacylglycerol kinase family enzyme
MRVRRLLLVTNPIAQRTTEGRRKAIQDVLTRRFDVDHIETKGPGHATEIAGRASLEGFDVVAVLGGDGTVNEVANGLAGTTATMAVLPGGGANIFSRALGLPRNLLAAAGRVAERDPDAPPRVVALGRADGRLFVSNCGVGLDAEIVRHVERRPDRKRMLGAWYFVWKGVGVFFRDYDRVTPHVRLRWGNGAGDVLDGLHLAIVQNLDPYTFLGRRPLRLCPQADVDGGLDCMALDTLAARTVLPVVLSAFGRARHSANPHVVMLTDQPAIHIECDLPLPFQMDGEFIGERTEVVAESGAAELSVLA